MVKIFICFNLYASMKFVSFDMEMWNFSNIICFDKDFEFIREVPNSCNLRHFCPFHVFIKMALFGGRSATLAEETRTEEAGRARLGGRSGRGTLGAQLGIGDARVVDGLQTLH